MGYFYASQCKNGTIPFGCKKLGYVTSDLHVRVIFVELHAHKPPAAVLSLLLHAGRVTRFSPSWKGFRHLQALYQKIIPEGTILRINNFDGDLKLDVNIRETVGLSLWHYPDLYEREERKLFCAAIQPGSTVLDVGANCGIYTLLAAKRGARVFSIEADPVNAALLRGNVALNALTERVAIFEMAATEREKSVTLFRNSSNWGGSNLYFGDASGSVPGKTLDSLKLPAIDVCKMDIEGSELPALRGMKETIARSPHLRLFVEYCRDYVDSAPLLSYLKENFPAFEVIGAKNGEIPPLCNILATRAPN